MNCYLHPETPASAFCRSCGRPLCVLCQRTADGTVYCQDHSPVVYPNAPPYANAPDPAAAASNPYYQAPAQPPPMPSMRGGVQTSPGLAFLLGWIPGVGAIYNGQYLKGLVHAVIFGLLISLHNSAEDTAGHPFLVMLLVAFIFYMPFEAYHTAKKRQMGINVEEWSSLMGPSRFASGTPIGPIVLIAIGILFLLDTLHVVAFRDIGRFWPVLLIVAGAWMLYSRVTTRPQAPPAVPPFSTPANPPADSILETRHES